MRTWHLSQWESYRRLGEHAAEAVFGASGATWAPGSFVRPEGATWTEALKAARAAARPTTTRE